MIPPPPMSALIVDDAPELRRLIAVVLERAGMDVAVAGDAESGLVLARSLRPTVAVFGLMLPGMDGVAACRRLRTFSRARTLLLTARPPAGILPAEVDDWMPKPFGTGELVDRVTALVRRPLVAPAA